MATKQITTWAEFKTALTETITENTTYEIMNDIDVSDEIQESTITCAGVSGSLQKTFNGNEHKINGLTSYSSIYFFTTTIYFTFNDIHFSNMMNQNGGFMRQNMHSSSDPHCKFNRCYFSGLTKYFATYITSESGAACQFSMCSFNLKCDTLQNAKYLLQFSNCYIILNPITQYCALTSNVGDGAKFDADNCYIGGLLASNWSDSYRYMIAENTGANNVFNCTFKFYNYSSTITHYLTSRYTNEVCLVNNNKFVDQNDTSITPTISHGSKQYLLTDSQLKSKTYIQQNTNFPLYG